MCNKVELKLIEAFHWPSEAVASSAAADFHLSRRPLLGGLAALDSGLSGLKMRCPSFSSFSAHTTSAVLPSSHPIYPESSEGIPDLTKLPSPLGLALSLPHSALLSPFPTTWKGQIFSDVQQTKQSSKWDEWRRG